MIPKRLIQIAHSVMASTFSRDSVCDNEGVEIVSRDVSNRSALAMNPPTRNVPAWLNESLPPLTCMAVGCWMGQSGSLGWLGIAITIPTVLFISYLRERRDRRMSKKANAEQHC
jgi:hypothetical protein